MMMETQRLISGLLLVTERWLDPDYSIRLEASAKSVAHNDWFTEEAIAFAINQQLNQVTADLLESWITTYWTEDACTVGVIGAGNVPFADFQDFITVLLSGHHFLGKVSSQSPYLLPAFINDLKEILPDTEARIAEVDVVCDESDLLIASGSDHTIAEIKKRWSVSGRDLQKTLLRGHAYGVAILGGNETAEARSGLAEDILLHEGRGCRNVAVIWAPGGYSPDRYLDMMAQFREVFPPAKRTAGSLKMQEAFLASIGQAHAVGPGFLVSKGDPMPQAPGHIRWAEYESLDEIECWIRERRDKIQVVVAGRVLPPDFADGIEILDPGNGQRPDLEWNAGEIDTRIFLRSRGT